jgi:hypothetical protein
MAKRKANSAYAPLEAIFKTAILTNLTDSCGCAKVDGSKNKHQRVVRTSESQFSVIQIIETSFVWCALLARCKPIKHQCINASTMSPERTDDEEELVREVIVENPVEDVGVREEWTRKEGWHRKDDVLGRATGQTDSPKETKRLRSGNRAISSSREHRVSESESNDKVKSGTTPSVQGIQQNSSQLALAAIFMGLCAVVLIFSRLLGRKKKDRSS